MKIPQSVRELLSKAYADPRTEAHQCSESFSRLPTVQQMLKFRQSFSIGSLGISEGYAWSSHC